MKPNPSILRGVLCGALLLISTSQVLAQANAKPPTQLTYQGFLTDANGVPFGNTTLVNKTLIFRIYDALTAGNLKWSSQQVVTIDKGYFSVLLGQGSAVGAEPFSADLTGVFAGGNTASDRYLELNADGTTIAPRLRFLPAPYAMLARSATELLDPVTGTSSLAISGGNLSSAGSITSGSITSGSVTASSVTASGNITATGNVSAAQVSGFGTIPLGGIIMWSGTSVPTGWALCDGSTVNSRTTPDLRGRFIVGAGTGASGGLTSRSVGAVGGNEQTALTTGQLPAHTHQVSGATSIDGSHSHIARAARSSSNESSGQGYANNNNHQSFRSTDRAREFNVPAIEGAGDHSHTFNVTSGSTGNGDAFSNLPPFYALAFIMRVQ